MARMWDGFGAIRWEHIRRWDLAMGSSEVCRMEGALVVPAGLTSFSVFFRRQSQSASTFDLVLWTLPVFYKPLDTNLDSILTENAFQLSTEPSGNLSIAAAGGGAKVFAAKLKSDQPMGTMLLWEMKNSGDSGAYIVGDIYLVPNHAGMVSGPSVMWAADVDASRTSPGVSVNRSLK